MRKHAFNILCSFICACTVLAPTQAIAKKRLDTDLVAALHATQKLDNRVLDIGYRLVSANAKYCRPQAMRAGMSLHDIAQYRAPKEARAAYRFDTDISVNAVVKGGPAEKAGIALNDGILAIEGRAIASLLAETASRKKRKNYARMEYINGFLDEALGRGQVTLLVKRGDKETEHVVKTEAACPSLFVLDTSKGLSAGSNGHYVRVTIGFAEYAKNDDELAVILAHELAHNLLKHRQRLKDAKVKRGLFKGSGRSGRLSKATELEADRLSLWLLANAGFNPNAAVDFWKRRRGGKGLKSIFPSGTHYRWKKRVRFLEQEMIQLKAAPVIDGLRAPHLLINPAANLAK